MPNCKPGDLAVIVRSKSAKENIGKIVRVVKRRESKGDAPGFEWANPAEISWIVESCGGPLAAVTRSGRTNEFRVRPYPDYCLRPIRPDSLGEGLTRHVDRTIKA